jgi:hypothetical protein
VSARKLARQAQLPVAKAVPAEGRREVARFLREQPPRDVPRRSWAAPTPGLVALSLLGGRVIRRFD